MNPETLSLIALEELNEVCEAFEEAWKAGPARPRIEDYLASQTAGKRAALFQMLLEVEIELRTRAGESPDPREYVGRFDPFADEVRSAFNRLKPHGETERLAPLTTDVALTDQQDATVANTTVTLPPGSDTIPEQPGRRIIPSRIGPYRVERLLAEGNFLVYVAHDQDASRQVAIKIAKPGDARARRRIMSLAEEAKKLKELNHPRIVKLYEYVEGSVEGEAQDGFIVLEYVEGNTLEELLRAGRLEPERLATITALVARAVHHAHTHRPAFVHRDLKPSNILLDLQGEPHVCDFGLALDEEVQMRRRREVAGTLHYMAPEQVRGEAHRLDGRTDIWALGVILYRGLTGKLPFPGRDSEEIFDEILHRDPRPPRMSDPRVDPELERICLRCLSRRMGDRYMTAADLASDLERWLASAASQSAVRAPSRIVPKGLLSFDEGDAGFFLGLLPGPRRGDGLPESIRFWKERIEALEGDKPFSVGLLYGPSGGGKSSFVKAGLLPNLEKSRVCTVYLEATPTGTSARLLAELRRVAPAVPGDADLPDAVALLRDQTRCRPAPKLFLVLDQFEQWLQAHPQEPDHLLVSALRQCDGRRVQALVLVRDDFWMAVTRFLRAIEVPLVQGGNAAAVELFDAPHARKVLEEFGRALGRLPSESDAAWGEASMFLAEVVQGLTAPDGRVIPVQLSLFTEVVRHRSWTRATLRAVGGVEGIGVKFLQEQFESDSSPHRLHRAAAQAILQSLLPAPTSLIRGAARTEAELRAVSGYSDRSADFDGLMHVLDHELRLVASTDPPESGRYPSGAFKSQTAPEDTYYELAHDYLIRPVRQWLNREKLSTRAGRAQLRLELITATWLERPGPRRLPSLFEWAGILWHVPKAARSPNEQRLMRAAAFHYWVRFCAAALILAGGAVAGLTLLDQFTANSLLREASSADDRKRSGLIAGLQPYREILLPKLEAVERGVPLNGTPHDRDLAGVLLYRFAPTVERGRYLRRMLLSDADPDRVDLIRNSLAAHPEQSGTDELWAVLGGKSTAARERLRVAATLARLAPRHRNWEMIDPAFARALLGEDRGTIPQWIKLLDPVLGTVIRQLDADVRDTRLTAVSREGSAEALAEALVLRGADGDFASPLVEAPPEAFRVLLRGLERCRRTSGAIAALSAILDEPAPDHAHALQREHHLQRQAAALIALLALGQPERLWPNLRHAADPGLRSLLIDRLGQFEVNAQPLLERVRQKIDPIELQGLLLALAEIKVRSESGLERVPPQAAGTLASDARDLYVTHPDAGVHSAAELLLRRWGRDDLVRACDEMLRNQPDRPPHDRSWELAPNGHTLAIVRGPVRFQMGSPTSEKGRFEHENRHLRQISHSFAVSTKEVTIEQYRAFDPAVRPDPRYLEGAGCAANQWNWFDAARYCNWLSAQAGIKPSQWCYPENPGPGMLLTADSIERTGFRLPTEAEWEYICRAGSETAHPFGDSEHLLARYAWTFLTSEDRVHPVGSLLPNELGMFDILGNVWEWCHDGPSKDSQDRFPPYLSRPGGRPLSDGVIATVIDGQATQRVLRGGAFDYAPIQARSAYRYLVRSELVEGTVGLRVVRTLPPAGTGP
jgi:serine/threonine protein kinase/formylglycine-generating enzyme required for sulfatase activity